MIEVEQRDTPLAPRLKGAGCEQNFNSSYSTASEQEVAVADATFTECSEGNIQQKSDDAVPGTRSVSENLPRRSSPPMSDLDQARGVPSDLGKAPLLDGSEPSYTDANVSVRSGGGLCDLRDRSKHFAAMDNATSTEELRPSGQARCVLVAKSLTNSDASSGRIILPRVAVEANLPFVTAYRHYALTVRDTKGRQYEFVIKSWANGTEHRRVFVLEQAGDFLRLHGVGVGDVVGICTDEHGELVVEANTPAVRQAVVSPRYGAAIATLPSTKGSGLALPLSGVLSGRCIRSVHCTKPAGHPGFCSGPKAAAAAAAAAAQAHAAGAAAAARYRRRLTTIPGGASSQRRPHIIYHADGSEMGVVPTYGGGSSFLDDVSSDETAGTTVVPSALADPSGYELPPGLHSIAHVPTGLRLCKVLTAYDLSSKRVILPAMEVDVGVPNATEGEVFTLAAVDESQGWHFPTLRAWQSVVGRRGYLLEGSDAFLTARGAMPGDSLVIYRDTDVTPPRIEVRAAGTGLRVRRPDVQDATLVFSQLPLLLHPEGYERDAAMTSRPVFNGASSGGMRGVACQRTSGCTKAAGHQGFCSGHKGFRRREGGMALHPATNIGGGVRHSRRVTARGTYRLYDDGRGMHDDDYTEDGGPWGSEDEEYTPMHKRPRHDNFLSSDQRDPLLSLLSLLDA